MELFAMGARLQRWSFGDLSVDGLYVDSRQDLRFCSLSKLMFYRG